MREDDLPFVAYRRGRFGLNIVPRNADGWRAILLWTLPYLLVTAGYVAMVASSSGARHLALFTSLFVFLSLVWSVALIRWSYARAQIIQVKD